MKRRSYRFMEFFFVPVLTVILGSILPDRAMAGLGSYGESGTAIDKTWQVSVQSSGEDISWSSPSPLEGAGPWMIDLDVASADIGIRAGGLVGMISSLLPPFQQQLVAVIQEALGTEGRLVTSLPATVISGHVSVPYGGGTPFEADILFAIDAEGYGRVEITGIKLGSIEVNIAPYGDITVYLDSFTAAFSVTFGPIVDCNGNGQSDELDLGQGLSLDRNLNGLPDECDPDQDRDAVPDDIDNCANTPNPDQRDNDGDGVGDVCETDWQVSVLSSGEDFAWTSPFPLRGAGPWVIDIDVVSADIGIRGEGLGGMISSVLPLFQQQLVAVIQEALGIGSRLVASLPATVISGHIGVPYGGGTPFEADILFTIDTEGYGHIGLTSSRLGSIEANVAPFGDITIYLDSFTAAFSVAFGPIIDCNGNGQSDDLDISQGLSFDRNVNGIPDDCDPDRDRDGVPDEVDNCVNTPNPDQRDSDGDGVGDACEADWRVSVQSSGEDFYWTSPFPLEGSGPWMIDIEVVTADIGIRGGSWGGVISSFLPLFQQQLVAVIQEALGTGSRLVASLPATVISGHIGVPYEGGIPFEADILFTIDAEGYGHIALTGISLGSIEVNIAPLGDITIYLDSFAANFLIKSSHVQNYRPLADAGQDQVLHRVGSVTLSASRSTDPDANYPLAYLWRFVSMPPSSTATLSAPSTVNSTFILDVVGDYVIELVVTDSLAKMSTPDVVLVRCLNSIPVADAGEDRQLSYLHTPVFLDGSRSFDEDQDDLHFSWSILHRPDGSNTGLRDPGSIMPSFVPDTYGIYEFGLVVTDRLGAASNLDTVRVTLDNIMPIAHAGNNQAGVVGEVVTLDGSSSNDANSDPLTFAWSFFSFPPGSKAVIEDRSSMVTTFIPDLPGTYVFGLVVNDGLQDSQPSTIQVDVVNRSVHLRDLLLLLIQKFNDQPDSSYKNSNMRSSLVNKTNAVIEIVESQLWKDALNKMKHDICAKTDGCSIIGSPDSNDWLVRCEAQGEIFPLVMEIIGILVER
jgi:hypothetical protein